MDSRGLSVLSQGDACRFAAGSVGTTPTSVMRLPFDAHRHAYWLGRTHLIGYGASPVVLLVG